MKTIRLITVVTSSVIASLTGCASITGDTTQMLRIETKAQSGQDVDGADCELSNEYGSYKTKTPGSVMVRKSSTDLFIRCSKAENPAASANAISRANGGMWGNIIFGGGVGAIIDHNKGTAYNYPVWMQLKFGEVLTFDRTDDKDGMPSFGRSTNKTIEPDASAKPIAQATN